MEDVPREKKNKQSKGKSKTPAYNLRSDIELVTLDALKMAEECGSVKAVNVVLLGVLASKLTEVSKDIWTESLKRVIPAKLYDINEKALQKGLNV